MWITLKVFLSAFIVSMALDMLWIGFIAHNFYMNALGPMLRKTNSHLAPVWSTSFLVYLCMTVGVVFFALPKGTNSINAFLWGALFGLVMYGIYDFTNYSLLKEWPLKLSIIDIAWGMTLCGLTTLCSFVIKRELA